MEGILNILPDKLTPLVKQELNKKSLQEIRLRLNQPIEFIFKDNITYTPYSVGKSDFSQMINLLSEHSFYRLANELKEGLDRKSTRLNSSHVATSYAVFCLKKKKKS